MRPHVALSLLFNSYSPLEIDCLKIGEICWNSTLLFKVCGVPHSVLETPRDIIIRIPSRTDNRIRSPRLIASGL